MSVRLRIPSRKNRFVPLNHSLLPNCDNISGRIDGKWVFVSDAEKMYDLQRNGSFGRLISGRRCQSEFYNPTRIIEKRRYERRKEWEECGGETSKGLKPDVIVVDDEAEEENEELKKDPYVMTDLLQLTLQEAFFLVYGVKCLSVSHENQELDLNTFWTYCCNHETNFIPLYICYHYYRSQRWVVKPGLKYAVDFLLYKDGPEYYHSTYSIIVQSATTDLSKPDPFFSFKQLNWTELTALNRITEHVSKDILLCWIIIPREFSNDNLLTPDCIPSFQVKEVLFRRWIAAQERKSD